MGQLFKEQNEKGRERKRELRINLKMMPHVRVELEGRERTLIIKSLYEWLQYESFELLD